jgi:hypothetical protein
VDFGRKARRKRPLERTRNRWEDNIILKWLSEKSDVVAWTGFF